MPFKSLTIDPAFPSDWRTRIETALPTLERILHRATDRVSVEWSASPGPHGEYDALLRLTDSGVSREERYAADEVAAETSFRGRLHDHWGSLLATRSHDMIRAILAGLDESEGV